MLKLLTHGSALAASALQIGLSETIAFASEAKLTMSIIKRHRDVYVSISISIMA